MVGSSGLEETSTVGATVSDVIRAAAARHADRVALIDGPSGASVTYAELADRVDRIAAWLHADGLGPGDRIALWAPNVPPFAAVALAAMRIGAAVTTLNPAAVDREVGAQVRDAGAGTIVTVPALATRARSLGLRRVVALGDGASDGVAALRDVPATPEPAPLVEVDPLSVALVPYSSGTTGLPKGVMLSHANLVAACGQLTRALSVTPGT